MNTDAIKNAWKWAKLGKELSDYLNYDEKESVDVVKLEKFLAWCKKEYPQIVAEYDLTQGVQI
jgi:hypothetical protein